MRDSSRKPAGVVLSHIFQRLTAPHPSLKHIEDRRKAQLLAWLFLASIPLTILSVPLVFLNYGASEVLRDTGFAFILVVLLLCMALYALSRSPYYVLAAALAVAITSVGVFGVTFFSSVYEAYFLGYLIIPVLLSNIFLSSRFTRVLLIFYVLTLIVFSNLLPRLSLLNLLTGPMLMVVVLSIMLMITNRYRNLLEEDRRSALEQSENRYRLVSASEREQRLFAEALRDTAAILTSTLNRDEVLDRILAAIAQVIPHDRGNIMLIEEENMGRIVRYHRFGDFSADAPERHLLFNIRETPTFWQMYTTHQPLLISDITTFPDWQDYKIAHWVKSYLGMPILSDNEVIGFLNLDSSHINGFTEKHLEQIQVFAHQATIAIRNATLYDEMEQRVARRTAELENERRQLQAILDSMGEGVYYTEDAQILYTNAMLARLTGYTVDEITQLLSTDLFSPNNPQSPEEIQQEKRQTLAKEPIWRKHVKIVGKAGYEFDGSLIVARVSEPDERPLRMVTVVRDISEEKALEDRKNRFISRASHELRTPVTNISTRLYLIQRQPDRFPEHLEVLEEVNERMKNLIEDLLDKSRLEQGQMQLNVQATVIQDLITSVARVQSAQAELKHISLVVNLTDEPLHVLADRERLIQVITNLVTNAINYTPEGGTVTLSLSREDTTRQALLQVEDTGIGIAREHLLHVFDPFYRIDEKVRGTGLGLSISREIIRLHHGEISVESTPGKGSCFTIKLGLIDEPPEN